MKWSDAFLVSLKIVLTSSLLSVFGLILVLAGLASLRGAPVAGLILIILGTIIASVSFLTSFMKYCTEAVAQEVLMKLKKEEEML